MTNLDWSPLDEDRNPVRGDPFATQDLATHFTERAGIINDVMAGLGRLSRDDQEATGLDELLRIRDELVPDLRLVEERYEQAAGALRPYCSALEDAQRMARDALDQATMAQDQIRRAQAGVEEMEAHERAANLPVIMPAGAPPPPPEPWAGPDWRQTVDDEEGNLEAARRLRDEAVALWEEAAGLAANRIGDAANDDLENEGGGLFGAIGDAISGAAQWVADNWPSLEEWSKILGAAAAVCGLLSLIPIPGFQVFGALALGIGALKLGIDTYLWATGRQGFGEVGMGLIGLATFGVGRAALAGARGAGVAAGTGGIATMRATVGGGRGALRGVVETMPNGTRLFGAAARSHRIRKLTTAVDDLSAAGTRQALPRGLRWTSPVVHRVSPNAPSKALLDLSPRATRYATVATSAQYTGGALDADSAVGAAIGASGGDQVKEHVFGDKPK